MFWKDEDRNPAGSHKDRALSVAASLAAALDLGIETQAAFDALRYRDDVPTVVTKLSRAHPPDGLEALAAIRASGGTVVALSDGAAVDAVTTIGARSADRRWPHPHR